MPKNTARGFEPSERRPVGRMRRLEAAGSERGGPEGESLSLRTELWGFGECPYLSEWSGDREAEGVRLESVCALTGYRGFESLSLRFPVLTRGSRAGSGRPTPSGPEGSSGKRQVFVRVRLR